MTADHEPWTTDPLVREDDALRGVLEVLSTRSRAPVAPEVRQAQVQAVLAEVRAHAEPARRPVRRHIRSILALTGVKVVLAGGIAAAGTTTGLATTGSLPAPAQQWAHDVGARLGVGLPAAPGQLAKVDGDPTTTGRDHAPGQVTRDDPDRNGRDAAPGRVGNPNVPPQQGPPEQAPAPQAPAGNDADVPEVDPPGRSGDAPGRSGEAPGRP